MGAVARTGLSCVDQPGHALLPIFPPLFLSKFILNLYDTEVAIFRIEILVTFVICKYLGVCVTKRKLLLTLLLFGGGAMAAPH